VRGRVTGPATPRPRRRRVGRCGAEVVAGNLDGDVVERQVEAVGYTRRFDGKLASAVDRKDGGDRGARRRNMDASE
jgi:hypothetical protein